MVIAEHYHEVAHLPTTTLHSIPTPPSDFTGRAQEIEQIEQVLRQENGTAQTICDVRGLGGIGKSVLAQKVAHDLNANFPDGQIFLALRGAREEAAMLPEEALREVLRAFGKEIDPNLTLDQLRSDYLSTLHDKRVLILADDANDEAQVKPLLPPPANALLITSRRLLRLPGMPPPLELGKLPDT